MLRERPDADTLAAVFDRAATRLRERDEFQAAAFAEWARDHAAEIMIITRTHPYEAKEPVASTTPLAVQERRPSEGCWARERCA